MFADPRSFVIVTGRAGFRPIVDEPGSVDLYRHAPEEWLDARESRQGWCCPLLNTLLWSPGLRRRDRGSDSGSYFG